MKKVTRCLLTATLALILVATNVPITPSVNVMSVKAASETTEHIHYAVVNDYEVNDLTVTQKIPLSSNYCGTNDIKWVTDWIDELINWGYNFWNRITKKHTHRLSAWNIEQEPTCLQEGQRERHCRLSGCNYTEHQVAAKLPHKYELTDSAEVTCTTNGYEVYTCQNGCNDSYTEITQKATGHNYKEDKAEATCTNAGYIKTVCSNCGDIQKCEIIPQRNHTYTIIERKDASCGVTGLIVYKCTQCEDTYSEELHSLEHEYYEQQYTKETCDTAGLKVYRCKNCNNTYETVIEATGHNYEISNKIEATCEQGGRITHTCKNCGNSFDETTESLGHDMVVVKETKATCTENGVHEEKCARCNKTFTNTTDALGHDMRVVKDTKATCTEDGIHEEECIRCSKTTKTVSNKIGHNYEENITDATCKKDGKIERICKNCGDTTEEIIKATGHDYEVTDSKEASCNVQGYIKHSCKKCDSAYTDILDALSHKYIDISKTEASCEKQGETLQRCENCNDEKIIYSDSLGHEYKLVNTVDSTCDVHGYELYECERCHKQDKKELPLEECKFTVFVKDTATCEEDGYKIYRCENCDKTISEVSKATGKHEYTENILVPATCEHDGSKRIECTKCGYYKVVTLSKTDHVPNLQEWKTSGTDCEHGGFEKYRVCRDCGKKLEDTVIRYTEHEYNTNWRTEKEATCGEDGYKVRNCKYCGTEAKETIPATGEHNLETNRTLEPTCTEKGKDVTTCKNCDYEVITEVSELGHNKVEKEVKATCKEDGYKYTGCTRCDLVENKETIPSTVEHQYEVKYVTNHIHSVTDEDNECGAEGYKLYTCKTCGDNYTEEYTSEHEDTEVILQEATCEINGLKELHCNKCGSVRTVYTDTVSHDLTEVTRLEPTCGSEGYIKSYCNSCKKYYEEFIPATGNHEFEITEHYDAKCTYPEKTVSQCKYCGEQKVELGNKTDENNHNFLEIFEELSGLVDKGHNYPIGTCADCGKQCENHNFVSELLLTLTNGNEITLNNVCENCLITLEQAEKRETCNHSNVTVAGFCPDCGKYTIPIYEPDNGENLDLNEVMTFTDSTGHTVYIYMEDCGDGITCVNVQCTECEDMCYTVYLSLTGQSCTHEFTEGLEVVNVEHSDDYTFTSESGVVDFLLADYPGVSLTLHGHVCKNCGALDTSKGVRIDNIEELTSIIHEEIKESEEIVTFNLENTETTEETETEETETEETETEETETEETETNNNDLEVENTEKDEESLE